MAVITNNIPALPRNIDLAIYDDVYQKKSLDDNKCVYVMECPIHGDFTIPSVYTTKDQEFMMCPSCVSFTEHLFTLYGKEATATVMKDIYRFSWDNKIIVDRIKKVLQDGTDRCNMIYKLIKEKVKGYKEPPLLTDMVADLENISEDEIVFTVDPGGKGKAANELEIKTDVQIKLDEFKHKLKELTLGTIEFVDLENKQPKALTQLTAICPIHGNTYTTSLADIHAHKIQCEHCIPYYNKLVEKYKEKQSFSLFMGIYDEYIKYKRNYPNVALSLKTLNALKEIKPDYHRLSEKSKIEEESQSQHLGTLTIGDPNPAIIGPLRSMDKDWNDLPQPVKASSKKGKATELIELLNNLTMVDIKSIRIEVDLETDKEMTVVTLKSGRVLTIID